MLAAGLGVTGSTLLCLSKMTHDPGDAGSTLAGIGLGLVAGATYATYSWCAQRLMNRGISRAASMGAVFGAGGILLVPVLLLTGAPLIASSQAFAVAAYMALIPMFLGYLLFGYGLARVTASTATTITLSEPAIAAILAVAVVGERLSTVGWTGLGIVAVALAVLAIAPTNTAIALPKADPKPASPQMAAR
jgi:DME family drug/metabolite transporter